MALVRSLGASVPNITGLAPSRHHGVSPVLRTSITTHAFWPGASAARSSGVERLWSA